MKLLLPLNASKHSDEFKISSIQMLSFKIISNFFSADKCIWLEYIADENIEKSVHHYEILICKMQFIQSEIFLKISNWKRL